MTKDNKPSGPVALKNVAAFMALTIRVVERGAHEPGIAVCSGYSGLGKSVASIFAQNKTRGLRVDVKAVSTPRTLLESMLKECGRPVTKRSSTADLMQQVIVQLASDQSRPLIIDEADRLIGNRMIELVRDLHDAAGSAIILVGEEALPTKLMRVEKVHNRVFDWMQAQPCDFDDTRELAKAFCPGLTLADNLVERIMQASDGRASRIVSNLNKAREIARNKNAKTLTLDMWGAQAFFSGKPPAERSVSPYTIIKAA